jgi:carboxylesterase type B
VIGVSINYRLGPFGFMASSEIQDEGSMNAGLKDQLMALQWIYENIEAFGGDPEKITIWGESAGAESVAMLLMAYGGKLKNLFRGAIMESGSSTTQQYYPVSYWQPQYNNITKLVGCDQDKDTLGCLRAVDIDKLAHVLNITNGLLTKTYQPTVDGDFIPDFPKTLLAQRKFVNVPMISGANLDEGTSFGPGNVNTTQQIQAWLEKSIPTLSQSTINTLLKLYPNDPSEGSPYGTGDLYSNSTFGLQYKRGASIGGDFVMIGPRRFTCETWARAGAKVYSYNWNQSDYTTAPQAGSTHFQEVVYVFDNPSSTFPQSEGNILS